MANFAHVIMIVITVSALTVVWYLNQNRAEDSARGCPRRGRPRQDLFAVESLAQEVCLGGGIAVSYITLNLPSDEDG